MQRQQILAILPCFLIVTILTLAACKDDAEGGGGSDASVLDGGDGSDISLDFLGGGDAGEDIDTAVPEDEDAGGEPVEPASLGGPCLGEIDCSQGEVCVAADPVNDIEGYCTILDCVTHDECDFGNADQTFCCADFGQFRGCFLEAGDAVCGDELGTQGDDCSEGGQSDCDGSTHACIELYGSAYCSAFCTPGTPNACPGGGWCYATGGGAGLCLREGALEPGEPCGETPHDCGAGMFCDGAFQDPPSPFSFCATICQRDFDCGEGEWCRTFPGAGQGTCIPEGEGGVGAQCVEDRWACSASLFCLNEGFRFARCANLCRAARDCDEGLYCAFFADALGACLPFGDGGTGEPCGHDPYSCNEGAFCVGGFEAAYNANSYCADNCDESLTICGDDFYCQDFGEAGSFCQPDGPATVRGACESVIDCPQGSACVFLTEEEPGRCQPLCDDLSDCAEDEWCTGPGGLCLPRGDRGQAESCEDDRFACAEGGFCGAGDQCIFTCAADGSNCTGDSYCTQPDPNGQRFCLPFGDVALGGACAAADDCGQGAFCAFAAQEVTGVCTTGCAGDEDCFPGSWCLQSGIGASACVPSGSVATGQSCAGNQRFSCAEDNLCFFSSTDGAYCGRYCTGFADSCGPGETCRFISAGLNFCMQVGDAPAGADCSADPTVCSADSVCVGAGTAEAFCAQICTFDVSACSDATECRFLPGGLGVCTPPGFDLDAVRLL